MLPSGVAGGGRSSRLNEVLKNYMHECIKSHFFPLFLR
ncbi:hypothetical protein SAMN05216202_1352 [Pseudomonas mucidolens]|uniref:Uncharacterized protein n=1 Tax=Pseudomonas mucidolens TaxID=46679 RepID=A0A1H2MB48_9PSED|nr:hypothetical protein SAMN05216202_1352 [Pseudomonas mucidolens]SQH34223.1 Uncharacterised protein [Pseudomonas mucidolens]